MQTLDEFLVVAKGNVRDRLLLAAVYKASVCGYVTADCLRSVEVPKDLDRRAYGICLGVLKNNGVLVVTGQVQTTQKASHGRQINVFGLARDWRSRWAYSDLPGQKQILDLPVLATEVSAQVDQDEVFEVLARAWGLADAGCSGVMDGLDCLRLIRDACSRWRPAQTTTTKDLFNGD